MFFVRNMFSPRRWVLAPFASNGPFPARLPLSKSVAGPLWVRNARGRQALILCLRRGGTRPLHKKSGETAPVKRSKGSGCGTEPLLHPPGLNFGDYVLI